jgi:DNA-directed RNA polymerase subunit omega
MANPINAATMMDPGVEELLATVDQSKFQLVTLAARRGREVNSYFNRLSDGLGHIVPPQVSSIARKPLSIALEEVAAGKIIAVPFDSEALAAEAAAAADAAAMQAADDLVAAAAASADAE